MEAREKLEVSREVIESYVAKTSGKSESLMDELELKAHLARMEAEDIWSERGQELSILFTESRETMTDLVGKAANELQEQFSKWHGTSSKNS